MTVTYSSCDGGDKGGRGGGAVPDKHPSRLDWHHLHQPPHLAPLPLPPGWVSLPLLPPLPHHLGGSPSPSPLPCPPSPPGSWVGGGAVLCCYGRCSKQHCYCDNFAVESQCVVVPAFTTRLFTTLSVPLSLSLPSSSPLPPLSPCPELQDVEAALREYDNVLEKNAVAENRLGLLDASSFLWRLNLMGVDTGSRWQKVTEEFTSHIGKHGSTW